jgi:hypothetical protein
MSRTRFKKSPKSAKKHKPRRQKAAAQTNGTANGHAPPAPITASSEDAEVLASIRSKVTEIGAARDSAKERKAAYKDAKSRVEDLSVELEEMIRESNVEMPLFNGAKPSANGATAPPAADDEGWREEKISGLTPKILSALGDHGLHTWGDLVDYQTPGPSGYQQRLTDIKGIGRGAVDKVDDARDQFLTKWRQEQDRRRAEVREVIEEVVVSASPVVGTVFPAANKPSLMDIANAAFPVGTPADLGEPIDAEFTVDKPPAGDSQPSAELTPASASEQVSDDAGNSGEAKPKKRRKKARAGA